MPNPPNSPAGSDIGPIPNASNPATVPASGEGGLANQQRAETAALGPRTVQADVASPLVEPREETDADADGAAAPRAGEEELLRDTNADGTQTTSPANAKTPWPEIDCLKGYEEVDAALTSRMKAKYGATLVDDMEDAQMLLSYLTRNALQEERKVTDDTITGLIAARYRLRTGVFDCEREETAFRKNYGIIAKAAAPVTVASLRDSLPTKPERRWGIFMEGDARSIAERKCFKYRDAAFLVLLGLLASQIYWTISSAVLKNTNELISEINKAPTETVYLARETERLNAIQKASQQNAVEPASSQTTPPSASPTPSPSERVDKTDLTLDELRSKLAEQDANYEMLSGLMKPVAALFFPRTLYAFESPGYTESKPPGEATTAKKPESIFIPTQFQARSATIRAVAGQVIEVMQKWLLPLLYGALGAMVFVVRTLSLQARDRLFRKEALVSLILRVYLGMISGLAIGWFWSQDTNTPGESGPMSLTTLSPFALAFVAGYGVELFFTLLDKIISTFTNKP